MSRHVKLGDDADATKPGMLHHINNVLPSVLFKVTVGTFCHKLWKDSTGNGEGLVLGQMPVEYIQLGI